jgi:hypothetical protein
MGTQIYGRQGISDPPDLSSFNRGGGGIRVGGIFHVGPSYVSPSCQLGPPSLITTYRLTPPPIKPPNHSYIPPPCSDVTLHYLLHATLHYRALPPHTITLPTRLTHVSKDMWQTMSARTCGSNLHTSRGSKV